MPLPDKFPFRTTHPAAFAWVLVLLLQIGCRNAMTPLDPPVLRRDINAVLADHDDRLLAMPGVVGVYVGLMADDKTPCLKVMLSNGSSELKRSIPANLEGYAVIPEVTGPIQPLRRQPKNSTSSRR